MNGLMKGQVVHEHAHNFDHLTYLPSGSALFEKLKVVAEAVTDESGNEVSPAKYEVLRSVEKKATDGFNFVLIEAGTIHRITALEDNTNVHCLFAHRNPQGEITQEYDGWGPAYV